MRLHAKVVTKLLSMIQNLGGHKDESKLKKALEELDLTVYTRKEGAQDIVLVETADYVKEITQIKKNA